MTMNTRQEAPLRAPAVQFPAEFEESAAAWSLDELEQLSDLESIRSAWSRTDDPYA
jgi:hypothetical protein